MLKQKSLVIIPDERIIGKIYFVRGEKVMFDRDLAMLYGVEARALNQAVKRNIDRFPGDFMFRLNKDEMENWKSQFVISNGDRMGLRKPLSVFTEQGIAMLSSVLNSKRAIQVNIQVIRTFTKMRRLLASNKGLREKMEAMERKYDKNFKIVFKVIAKLMKTDTKGDEMKIAGFSDKV